MANKSRSPLQLSGALTIENAATLAADLQAAITPDADLFVDLTAVTELDLPALQILYAAAKTAQNHGRVLGLTGKLQPEAVRRLISAGFIRDLPPTAEQLMAQLPDFPGKGMAK